MTSTGTSVGATSAMLLKSSCIAGDDPMSDSAAVRGRTRPASRSSCFSSARSTIDVAWSRSNGLTRYSKAPLSSARTAVSRSPNAVITTIGTRPSRSRNNRIAVKPSIPGRRHVKHNDVQIVRPGDL